MANSRLLLRTSCNSKPPVSFVRSSSAITIRCSTSTSTPAKGLGFKTGDQKINNGDHQSNQMYMNKDSHHCSRNAKPTAALATSGSLITSAAIQPRDDEQVHGGIFALLTDLVSANSLGFLLLMLRNRADLINQVRNSFNKKLQLQMFFEKVRTHYRTICFSWLPFSLDQLHLFIYLFMFL